MESVEELCDHVMMINNAEKVLDGSLFDVQQNFKENAWNIGTLMPINIEINGLDINFIEKKNNINLYEVKSQNSNQIPEISAFLPQVNQFKLMFLEERLPSINDIFIKFAKEPVNHLNQL